MSNSFKPAEDPVFGYNIACGQGALGYYLRHLKHKPRLKEQFQGCSCCSVAHPLFFLNNVEKHANFQRLYFSKVLHIQNIYEAKLPFKSSTVQNIQTVAPGENQRQTV